MDRRIVRPSQLPAAEDFLEIQIHAMRESARLISAITGNIPTIDGMYCLPTSPATLAVYISDGTMYFPTVVDGSAFGVVAADYSGIMKAGSFGGLVIPVSTPTAPGTEIILLVQAAFIERDENAIVLDYYNAANPAQPLSGQGNSGVAEYIDRLDRALVSLKPGSPALSGTAVAPGVDAGSLPIALIRIPYGAVNITADMITAHPQASRFKTRLTTDLSGLASQGVVNNLSTSLAAEILARTNADTAINNRLNAIPTRLANMITFNASTTWTVPVGCSLIKVHVSGSGGGGGASGSSNAGGGGGAGGTAIGYFAVNAGDNFVVTVGLSGLGGIVGANGYNGNSSSLGSLISSTGGTGGGGGSGSSAGGAGGAGYGGQLTIVGGDGGDGSTAGTGLSKGGEGAGSHWGGGGRAATISSVYQQGKAYGSGGGAGYFSPNISGGPGQIGVVIIEF